MSKFTDGKLEFRQGDVGLIFRSSLPKTAKKIEFNEKDRHVLAYGEVTGHAHAFYDLDSVEVFKDEETEIQYILAKQDLELKHGDWDGANPDHSPIQVPQGTVFEVDLQVYYDYWTDSNERVAD